MQPKPDACHPKDIYVHRTGEIITFAREIIKKKKPLNRPRFCGKMQNLFDLICPVVFVCLYTHRQIIERLTQNYFIKHGFSYIFRLC